MYSYERIINVEGEHFRVRDAQDNRVATCFDEGNAKTVVKALNAEQKLTFSHFGKISLSRSLRWHKGGLEEWSEAEWTNALCGEAGEVANAAKKLLRLKLGNQQHDGDTTVPLSIAEARAKVAKEVGDTVAYADLVCHRIGWRLEDAVRMAFNQVSEREGFPERL